MTRDEEIKYLQKFIRVCGENRDEAILSRCSSVYGWQRQLENSRARLVELIKERNDGL